ncbi:MAG: DUF58 domain-containing protein [Armatimonadetes bacterium]|nr:DUF58 domain-containing protein [Armatimonadota bacterium]
MIPTRRFWFFLALGIPIALLGAVFTGMEKVLLPYNVGLFLAYFGTALAVPSSKRISVTRRFDQVLSVRASNRVEITIENESGTVLHGRLLDTPPDTFEADQPEQSIDIEDGRQAVLHYHAVPAVRGREEFGDVYLRLHAPLGLVDVIRTIPLTQEVKVYPNVLALREFDVLKQRGRLSLMGIRKARIKGQGTEFESLREYRDDDYRRIDWKSTARRNRLVVRDYETERNQPVLVCVDIGRHMMTEMDGVTKLDHALDACLMLLHAAASAGDLTGLLVYSDRVHRFIPPRKGRAQSGAILDAVHSLQADPVESNHVEAFSYLATRWKRRSMVVVFSDAEDESQARDIVAGLLALRRRHLVFTARVKDPRLRELEEVPLQQPTDLYKRSAALWYSTQRKRAEMVLSSVGLQSIDSEPQDLAQSLVTAYMIVKETAAL